MNEHIPDIETYIKRLNWYLQEHYPANKKITAEEWNALFLALINQGNAQEDTLAKICNEYLPLQIEKINTLVDTTNEHEASIAQLRTDTNKALKDSNYAVITADTALNQVVEKMGTVAYINNVLAPSLHYTRDPQAQLDDTAQGIINLQNQIDLMEQNTNVADVVGTFVDLVNYDKSKITTNDIVEVLQDETNANADTYYRLVENAWVYIGKLGSYYTRGESDALLAEKVNYADYKDTLSFAENERQKSKNLLDINKAELKTGSEAFSTLLGGTITINAGNKFCYISSLTNLCNLKPNISYTLSYVTNNGRSYIYQYIEGGTGFTWYNGETKTFTQTELDSIANSLLLLYGSTDSTVTYSNIQVEEGSVATTYQPYYGQITHNEDAPVVFAEAERQKSKNLFTTQDNSKYGSSGTYNIVDLNSFSLSYGSGNVTWSGVEFIINNLKPNTTYNFSLICDSDYRRLYFQFIGLNTASAILEVYGGYLTPFNTGDNTSIKIRISSGNNNLENSTFNITNVQLEEGSVATDYQPYNGEIVHNGDPAVEFAESERQKSKNLFDLNYNGTFGSTTEISVSKYISLKSVYGEKFTINTNLPQYSFTRGNIGDIFTNIIFNNLKPSTSYTISFVPISVTTESTIVHFLGVYNVQDRLGTKVTRTITTDENGRFNIKYGIWISAQNTTFTVSNVQIEEGSTATAYHPYSGEITHNGDPAVKFADSERQKSKNLIPFPYYEGNSKTMNGITFTVNNDQSVSVAGSITNHDSNAVMYLAWDMPLKAGTYSTFIDSSNTDINVVVWIGDNYYSGEFTLSSDTTAKIYLQVVRASTQTFNTTVKFMLCEGGIDTDYQPYYGAIVHQIDIAPVVLYDKNSTNPNINKGYTSGIMTDGVGNVRVSIDFSPYKKVKIYANLDRMNAVSEYDFTSGTDQFSILGGDIASARAKVNYMSGYISNTEFRPVFAGLAETAKDNNANYYVYRIEGIK